MLKRLITLIFPRWSMLIAIRYCEKAMEYAPDTPEGRVLKATLANYFQRKQLIEAEILFASEETKKLAQELQARTSLVESKRIN